MSRFFAHSGKDYSAWSLPELYAVLMLPKREQHGSMGPVVHAEPGPVEPLRLLLVSYQDYHMLCVSSLRQALVLYQD